MTPEPNFADMPFKPFAVNEDSTIIPELDPGTNFLKVFFPLVESISL